MAGRKFCPLCNSRGVQSSLKLYQINEEEAVYMCTSPQCLYPVGVCDPSLVIEKRHIPGLKDELEQVDNDDVVSVPLPNTTEQMKSTEQLPQQMEIDFPKTELDLMLESILSEEQD